jgi:hypothetical protein
MRKTGRWTAWFLASALLVSWGCSGILMETKQEDGRVERIKVDGCESWSFYEDKPRLPGKRGDDLGIMLKKEATF